MALSLRARLVLILAAVHLGVLGFLAVWVGREIESRGREVARSREDALKGMIRAASLAFRPRRAGDLREILLEGPWEEFPEAVVVDERIIELGGELVPVGAVLAPGGSRLRRLDFPLEEVVSAVSAAAHENRVVFGVAGGLALPMVDSFGRSWGGIHLGFPPLPWERPSWVPALLGVAGATLAGALAVYLFLGRGVIGPVERLAAAVRAFGAGRRPRLEPERHAPEFRELVGAFEDMMERILGFQAELEREVEAATRRAQEAERRAARGERLAAMGTLAAGLAHEINSPLAGALHGLETLRREARSERARRHGALTAEALQRIGSLVQRLLRLAPARAEPGRARVQEVAAGLPDFLGSRLTRDRLILDLPEEPLEVACAAGDLFPVLLNLVQNSLDALEEQRCAGGPAGGGEIRIAGRREAGWIRLQVEDDGPGVPAGALEHLFEPFYTTKEPGEGTGLGLALAHATVRQLGGSIEARPRPGGGLVVEIRLPEAPPEP